MVLANPIHVVHDTCKFETFSDCLLTCIPVTIVCLHASLLPLFPYMHPCAFYSGAVQANLWPNTQTLPFFKTPQQGCQSAGLELRIPMTS